MPKATFIQPNGTAVEVDAALGKSFMQAAVDNAVDGIEADCGGSCACATCHVQIGAPWAALLPEQSAAERELLEGFATNMTEESRLSCQITVTAGLDGIVLRVPPK